MQGIESWTPEEKREALERALGSRTFARSDQLRSFLRYVCEAEFDGKNSQLTEYVIGVEVLRRPANYSPSEDSSVRTRAYELRQKLERLYASELPNEPVQIVIPKGAYAPHFTRTPLLPPPQAKPLERSDPEIVRPSGSEVRGRISWRGGALLLATAVVAASVGAVLALAFSHSGLSRVDPVVAEAWSPFAKRNDTVLLIPATPLYLVLGPATHRAFHTATYPAPAEAYALFREHRPLEPDARLGMIFTNDALGVGSMNAVLLASDAIKAMGASPQILPERQAIMSVLHGRDAILFGAPVDSQAITEILDKTPLSVAYDEGEHEFVIKDRVSGRSITPEKDSNGDFHSVYGLVTVLNTRESDRGRLGMVVFSGITSVGTHGAAEYFTSPRSLHALRGIFAREGIRGFPAAYQVVVKCRFENMLLVSAEYSFHRVLRRE